ncbi:two-component response regulator [Bradyrhizobium diazoefficiens]|uniref:Two-component response regulator n=2 Tax=Bradyrhizobium diazoefficiens TaxID=1355477 RepID=A0A0E4G045_9BRAD|nr:putative two-component response regulator [Bradyrhizobium diazoefficiens SEMIA 5080]BAR62506.1 two-component response regulator [Bradyrhizobium diazoefficiens]
MRVRRPRRAGIHPQRLHDKASRDLAILDINLQGINVHPVAEVVKSRGLPLFFLSGYGSAGVPDGFEGMPVLIKPCSLDALKRIIDAVLPNGEPEKPQDKP